MTVLAVRSKSNEQTSSIKHHSEWNTISTTHILSHDTCGNKTTKRNWPSNVLMVETNESFGWVMVLYTHSCRKWYTHTQDIIKHKKQIYLQKLPPSHKPLNSVTTKECYVGACGWGWEFTGLRRTPPSAKLHYSSTHLFSLSSSIV